MSVSIGSRLLSCGWRGHPALFTDRKVDASLRDLTMKKERTRKKNILAVPLPWSCGQRKFGWSPTLCLGANHLGYTLRKPRRRHFLIVGYDICWPSSMCCPNTLWVQPLKANTNVTLVKAFEKILRQGREPIQLQTDRGTEFYNQTFQRFLKKQGIYHFSTQRDAKASVVDGLVSRWKDVCTVISPPPT